VSQKTGKFQKEITKVNGQQEAVKAQQKKK
jgi:hypothetical protein